MGGNYVKCRWFGVVRVCVRERGNAFGGNDGLFDGDDDDDDDGLFYVRIFWYDDILVVTRRDFGGVCSILFVDMGSKLAAMTDDGLLLLLLLLLLHYRSLSSSSSVWHGDFVCWCVGDWR